MYINRVDEITEKCDNTYHRKIKMKPAHVQRSMYIEYGVEHNK